MRWLARPSVLYSLMLAVLAFGLDRAHKHFHVSPDCISFGEARCVTDFIAYLPLGWTGWRGGEIVWVTGFFDYVLVWNTGISWGLLGGVPFWVIGVLIAVAMGALAWWWVTSESLVIRAGLGLCLGGALSNAVDRLIYGAVADFFHFHFASWSFFVFNLADAFITLGVALLLLDLLGVGRGKRA